jgi:integrase
MGWRSVALDPETVAVLRSHRARQLEERLLLGPAFDDQGLVVAKADGSPLHPTTLSWHFGSAVRRSGLPAIRLHDLRHSHATLALKAGVILGSFRSGSAMPTWESRWTPTVT